MANQFLQAFVRIFIAIIFCLLVTGCASSVQKLANIMKDDNESKAVYATGVVDALGQVPEENRVTAVVVASDLARNVQTLEGLPNSDKRLDVRKLIAGDAKERERVNSRERSDSKNATEKTEVERHLIDLGIQKEAENHQNFVKRFWHWAIGVLGLGAIGGTIVLCIFFPPLGLVILKLLAMFFGWVVGKIPALVHLVGVVAAGTFTRVVSGVEAIKTEVSTAKKADPAKTFTADEVLAMFKTNLSIETDQSDKKLINTVQK